MRSENLWPYVSTIFWIMQDAWTVSCLQSPAARQKMHPVHSKSQILWQDFCPRRNWTRSRANRRPCESTCAKKCWWSHVFLLCVQLASNPASELPARFLPSIRAPPPIIRSEFVHQKRSDEENCRIYPDFSLPSRERLLFQAQTPSDERCDFSFRRFTIEWRCEKFCGRACRCKSNRPSSLLFGRHNEKNSFKTKHELN